MWPPSFQGQVTQFTFLDHIYTIITVANHNVFCARWIHWKICWPNDGYKNNGVIFAFHVWKDLIIMSCCCTKCSLVANIETNRNCRYRKKMLSQNITLKWELDLIHIKTISNFKLVTKFYLSSLLIHSFLYMYESSLAWHVLRYADVFRNIEMYRYYNQPFRWPPWILQYTYFVHI